MHQQLTKATTLILTVLALIAGCGDSGTTIDTMTIRDDLARSLSDELASATLTTRADVEHVLAHAVNSGRAIIFVHMDWAPMAAHRELYSRFVVD